MKNKKVLFIVLAIIIVITGVRTFVLPSNAEKLSTYVNENIDNQDDIYFEIRHIETGEVFKQTAYKYQFYKDGSYFLYRYIDDGVSEKVDEEYYCSDNVGIIIKDKYVVDTDECIDYMGDDSLPQIELIFDFLLDSKSIEKYFDQSYKAGGVNFSLNDLGKKEIEKAIGIEVDDVADYSIQYFHRDGIIELRTEYYKDDVEVMEFVYYENANKLKVPTLKNYELE